MFLKNVLFFRPEKYPQALTVELHPPVKQDFLGLIMWAVSKSGMGTRGQGTRGLGDMGTWGLREIGFSKIHSRHPSQSSTVKQSRRPNDPLLTLQLKFHVAAFVVVVVVVAQKRGPYDFFSVTEV